MATSPSAWTNFALPGDSLAAAGRPKDVCTEFPGLHHREVSFESARDRRPAISPVPPACSGQESQRIQGYYAALAAGQLRGEGPGCSRIRGVAAAAKSFSG